MNERLFIHCQAPSDILGALKLPITQAQTTPHPALSPSDEEREATPSIHLLWLQRGQTHSPHPMGRGRGEGSFLVCLSRDAVQNQTNDRRIIASDIGQFCAGILSDHQSFQ